MSRHFISGMRLNHLIKTIFQLRFIILIFCLTSFTLYWNQLGNQNVSYEVLAQELIENASKDARYAELYRKTTKLPKDLKYILLWTPEDYAPFYFLDKGQRGFIKNNCSMINCYVTANKKFLGYDVSEFDAVAFNGRNLQNPNEIQLPVTRSPKQKYIFFNMESADNYPMCDKTFDNFFNWTSTYKLNSDIPYPYILIRNNMGKIIGPKRNMKWRKDARFLHKKVLSHLGNKTKAVAWFVSHCSSRSNRKKYVDSLENALGFLGLDLDIYGKCGTLECPKDKQTECDQKLERDYFFYLAMENSFAEDYVTEKIITALNHYTVPIVYGGADYSRFLPPNSYLDARKQSPEDLAAAIHRYIKTPKLYHKFFRWRTYYTYHDPGAAENVCALCAALNNNSMVNTHSSYKDFRGWWNVPGRCKGRLMN